MSAMLKLMPPRPTRPEQPAPIPAAPAPPDEHPPVYRGDWIALLFWAACASLIAILLVKDLFVALLGLASP